MSDETLTIVTWVGTILSGLGAAIAVWQACVARSYRDQIRVDIRKLGILRTAELLRRALDFIRKFPSDSSKVPRGGKTETLIEQTKECFDHVLGLLPKGGADEDVRKQVCSAQNTLTGYEHALNSRVLSAALTAAVQSPVQDAVSLANDRALKIEGKA